MVSSRIVPFVALAATAAYLVQALKVHTISNVGGVDLLSSQAAQWDQQGTFMQKISIPLVALTGGCSLMLLGHTTLGMLAMYFGAQSGFSLYMKVIMSSTAISAGLQGFPAAFLITAIQQLVAFVVLLVLIAVSGRTRWRHSPQRLDTVSKWMSLLVYSLAFALNIGLNNFSLSLMAVSMNLIVRSCVPLVTLGLHVLAHSVGALGTAAQAPSATAAEVVTMASSVLFAVLATVAEREGVADDVAGDVAGDHRLLLLGVLMCGLSDVAVGVGLILTNLWKRGEANSAGMVLGPIDMTLYTAVPAAAFLVPAILCAAHPVEWPGYNEVTDWEILWVVLRLKPAALAPVILSGVMAAAYNIFTVHFVQHFSATHAAFAGNFNKAATILLSICMGLEQLPKGSWGYVMVFAVAGNILSFTGYSLLKAPATIPIGKRLSN